MKNQFFLFTALAFLLTACFNEDSIWNSKQANRVTSEAREMLDSYVKAVNEKGLMAELSYLDSTDQFSWHPPGFDGPISYDSVAAIIKRTSGLYASIQSRWDTLTVMPATKSTAIYIGELTSEMTDTTGRMITLYVKEEGMLVKRVDGWKLLRGKTVLKN